MARTTRNGGAPQILQRERQVLDLRTAGATFAQIATQLGITQQRANQIYHRALLRTVREPADEARQLDALRLDRLLLGIWGPATQGEAWAIDRALHILNRRAKLFGLDAPVRHEVLTIDAIDAEISRLQSELAATDPDRAEAATAEGAP